MTLTWKHHIKTIWYLWYSPIIIKKVGTTIYFSLNRIHFFIFSFCFRRWNKFLKDPHPCSHSDKSRTLKKDGACSGTYKNNPDGSGPMPFCRSTHSVSLALHTYLRVGMAFSSSFSASSPGKSQPPRPLACCDRTSYQTERRQQSDSWFPLQYPT